MSTHQIKINRATKLAPASPAASAEIMDSVSDYLLERLTAAELAEVRRCLNKHWHKAVAHAQAEAVSFV